MHVSSSLPTYIYTAVGSNPMSIHTTQNSPTSIFPSVSSLPTHPHCCFVQLSDVQTGTTLRLIAENVGPGLTFEKEVGQLMIKMGTEFVLMISSVGYEFAEKEGMSTIAPRHIIAALLDLGYGEYVDEIEELVEALKTETKRKVCMCIIRSSLPTCTRS